MLLLEKRPAFSIVFSNSIYLSLLQHRPFEHNSGPGATLLALKMTAFPSNHSDKQLEAVFILHAEQTQNRVQFISLLTLLPSATTPWTRGSR